VVIGGKGAQGQVVVVVRHEGVGGGRCHVVVVSWSPSFVVGEGAKVVGDGARWSEVGRGVIVVVVGEGLGMGWLSEVREVGWWGSW
jgi:hypothetical protein